MNNSIFGYKEFLIKSIDENQILEKSFSFDENEDKGIDNINEKTIEKFNLKNKLFEEKDFYLFNYLNDNNQIKFDNLPLPDFNSSLTSTNNSKKSHFLNENNIPQNKEVKINSIYPKKEKIFKIAKTNRKIGRIKKDSLLKGKHDKLSEDNIIRKLKRYILDYILLILNHSFKYRNIKFLSLNKKMKERLKRDENLELLNRTIADIFSNTKMNKVSEKKGKSNKDLIIKIYEENIETETIKILDMTFQEILNEIRDKYLDDFLRGIKEKEIKMESKNKKNNNYQKDFDIEKYLDEIKVLLFKFEEWFKEKNGRNRIKEDIN